MHWSFTTMTEETKKTWFWTGGLTAGLVALMLALWLFGMFGTPVVQ